MGRLDENWQRRDLTCISTAFFTLTEGIPFLNRTSPLLYGNVLSALWETKDCRSTTLSRKILERNLHTCSSLYSGVHLTPPLWRWRTDSYSIPKKKRKNKCDELILLRTYCLGSTWSTADKAFGEITIVLSNQHSLGMIMLMASYSRWPPYSTLGLAIVHTSTSWCTHKESDLVKPTYPTFPPRPLELFEHDYSLALMYPMCSLDLVLVFLFERTQAITAGNKNHYQHIIIQVVRHFLSNSLAGFCRHRFLLDY